MILIDNSLFIGIEKALPMLPHSVINHLTLFGCVHTLNRLPLNVKTKFANRNKIRFNQRIGLAIKYAMPLETKLANSPEEY